MLTGERSCFREGGKKKKLTFPVSCPVGYYFVPRGVGFLQVFWLKGTLVGSSQGSPLLPIQHREQKSLPLTDPPWPPLRRSTFQAVTLPRYGVLFSSPHLSQSEMICSRVWLPYSTPSSERHRVLSVSFCKHYFQRHAQHGTGRPIHVH